VIILGMVVIAFSIFEEIQNFKIYNKKNISIPIVFNISNPADSQNALNQLFNILEDKDKRYKNHKHNLKKYFNSETYCQTTRRQPKTKNRRRDLKILVQSHS